MNNMLNVCTCPRCGRQMMNGQTVCNGCGFVIGSNYSNGHIYQNPNNQNKNVMNNYNQMIVPNNAPLTYNYNLYKGAKQKGRGLNCIIIYIIIVVVEIVAYLLLMNIPYDKRKKEEIMPEIARAEYERERQEGFAQDEEEKKDNLDSFRKYVSDAISDGVITDHEKETIENYNKKNGYDAHISLQIQIGDYKEIEKYLREESADCYDRSSKYLENATKYSLKEIEYKSKLNESLLHYIFNTKTGRISLVLIFVLIILEGIGFLVWKKMK